MLAFWGEGTLIQCTLSSPKSGWLSPTTAASAGAAFFKAERQSSIANISSIIPHASIIAWGALPSRTTSFGIGAACATVAAIAGLVIGAGAVSLILAQALNHHALLDGG